MKNSFFFLLLLPLMAFAVAHKFYVSATNIKYHEEAQALQITSHVFTDDLENALKMRYGREIFLTKEEEHPLVDNYIQNYFQEKFSISVNGKQREFEFLRKEFDKDQVQIFLEIEKVEALKILGVKNDIFTELFSDHKNIIKVAYDGKVKSLLLMKHAPEGTLIFSN